MKGILYKENNNWMVRWYDEINSSTDSTQIGIIPLHPGDVKNHGHILKEYTMVDFDIIPVFVEKEGEECVNGEDVPHARIKNTENILYSSIEDLIIRWSNDGTKTAGTLTRQIMSEIKKHSIL